MIRRKSIAVLAVALGFGAHVHAQSAFEDDIQEYNPVSGIGCISKTPITKNAEFYFVCRSKRSDEYAWNAALYRGKMACGGRNFSVFFNIRPSLPKENGIYGAQVELRCVEKP
ncbi:MAG: hypothetical protein ABL862_07375 [Candidatus Nitrotoga sp.]